MKRLTVRGLGIALAFCTASWGQGRGDRPTVPPTGHGEIRPHSWIRGSGPDFNESPQAGPGSAVAFYPSDIYSAYGITPSLGGGSGVTIAIIDAYDSPNAEADLGVFSTMFGLPACTTANGCFKKVNESGGTVLPPRNTGWEVEINLDVQWVHAMAPNARILLVEASSANSNDLLTGVLYAKQVASVVSMSWGGGEASSETQVDSAFVQSGVTFLSSSGDTGGQVSWPSSSPNVIAVGATDLASSGGHLATPVVETAWSGTGGGCSLYESQPVAQNGFVPSSCRNRGVPDVSMNGGNVSAVAVYVSLEGGWYSVYGTSVAVQLYAGFMGTVNGLRGRPLTSALSDLYAAAAGSSSGTSTGTTTSTSTPPTPGSPSSGIPGAGALGSPQLLRAAASPEGVPGVPGAGSGSGGSGSGGSGSGGSGSGGSGSSGSSGSSGTSSSGTSSSSSSLYLLDFRDITSGIAGSFSAGPGWDFTSGLGSPLAGSLAPFLVSKP